MLSRLYTTPPSNYVERAEDGSGGCFVRRRWGFGVISGTWRDDVAAGRIIQASPSSSRVNSSAASNVVSALFWRHTLRNALIVATLILCALAASSSAAALQQDASSSEDQVETVFCEKFCGGGWATSECTLATGEVIRVYEQKYQSEDAADEALETALLDVDAVLDRDVRHDQHGQMLGRSAIAVKGTAALQIERSGLWVIRTEAPSLDLLRQFIKRGDKAQTTEAPPN